MDENEELLGQWRLCYLKAPSPTRFTCNQSPVKGADIGANAGSDVIELLALVWGMEATQSHVAWG